VAVRALCEFTARSGDLDLRFTPAPSALEGMEAMPWCRNGVKVGGYETELVLGRFEELQVRGRADGFDAVKQQLEEIKTYRGRLTACALITGPCTGPRPRSTVICCVRSAVLSGSSWRWSISRSASSRRPCW
jgi:hypothetical protein